MLQNPLNYCLFLADLPALLWELSGIVTVRTESESLVPLLVTPIVVFDVGNDDAITSLHTLLAVVATVVDLPHLWVPLTVDDTSSSVLDDIPDEFLPIH